MSDFDPTSVTATAGAAGSGSATVSWTQPVAGAPGRYFVYTGALLLWDTLLGTVISVTVSGLANGQAYTFYVTTDLGGYSALSNSITVAQPQSSNPFGALPTTLPATAGVLWNNGGVLCVS